MRVVYLIIAVILAGATLTPTTMSYAGVTITNAILLMAALFSAYYAGEDK